jgi:hypothetical protein
MASALDPDKQGALVWQLRVGQGSGRGGQWGGASDGRQAYFGINGSGQTKGGVVAVDVATGERVGSRMRGRHRIGAVECHGKAVERGVPAECVEIQVARHIVHAGAGMAGGDGKASALALVAPAVWEADHPRQHAIGDLDGHDDRGHG